MIMKGFKVSEIILLSRREIHSIITGSDIVVEVLDIRIPEMLRNHFLENTAIRSGKRLVILLNKSDLIPRDVAEEWVRYYREKGYEAYSASVIERRIGGLRRVIKEHLSMSGGRSIYISIFGAPKVGKSSLVNLLKGRRSATVSRYPGTPGYTRYTQTYRVMPGVYLIDTPGALPIELDTLESIIRTRPPEKIENPIPIAIRLMNRILSLEHQSLREDLKVLSTRAEDILSEYALRRGWVRNGEPDMREAAIDIIRRYLDGRIRFYIKPEDLNILQKI
ncbi:MAG: GTPase [Sulfolobales archaeon]